MRHIAALFFALSAVGASCSHAPLASTPPDAALCRAAADLGCRVGDDASCAVAVARERLLDVVPDHCYLAALSKAAWRACGPVIPCP